MDHPITPDNPESGQPKAHALATTLTVHGVISLCITILIVAPIIAGHAPNWASWMLVLLVGTPLLCFLGSVLLRACRHSARTVSALALISILPFWGVVTLPITGGLIFLCVYGLEGSQPNRPAAELPFYVGHAVLWLIAWYFAAGKHLRWLWSQTARVTLSARSPLRVWRSLQYAILFIIIFIAGTAFLTIRNSLITQTKDAGLRNDIAYLRKVWLLPGILLPRRVKEDAVIWNVANNAPSKLQWFLDHGLSPDAHDTTGDTPLHIACMHADIAIVQLLISRGARVNSRNMSQETPVYWLAQGAPGSEGKTNSEQRVRLVGILADAGADMNAVDDQGFGPLWASRNAAVLRALLAHGANAEKMKEYAREKWYLPLAARDGNLELVELALEYGADINVHDHSEGDETALHAAVKNGHLQVVRYLVNHGSDTHATDWRGKTPIDYARNTGRADIIKALHR